MPMYQMQVPQVPIPVYSISPNPFEFPPGQPTYIWFYKDPKGFSQGPFNAFQMQTWHNEGYFTSSLLVSSNNQQFYPLSSLIQAHANLMQQLEAYQMQIMSQSYCYSPDQAAYPQYYP